MVRLGLPAVQAGASKHAFGPTVTVTPIQSAHMLISVSIRPNEALLALLLAQHDVTAMLARIPLRALLLPDLRGLLAARGANLSPFIILFMFVHG
jgi:hypothetical protein